MTPFREELVSALRGPLTPMVWASLTVILGLSGPLGTVENCTILHRTLFWSVTVGILILLNALLRAYVHAVLGWRHMQRDIPMIAGAVAIIAILPFRAVAQGHVVSSHAILSSTPSETLVFLFLTALGIGGYSYLTHLDRVQPVPVAATAGTGPSSATADATLPRLVMRLDPAVQGRLVSITGRDHYVDVRTLAGQTSILMRFSDAVAEAAPQDGAQVHRSHWVAWDAVSGVERDGARLFLKIGQDRIPVSRANRSLLAARGLV